MDSARVEQRVVVLILDVVEHLPEDVFLSFELLEEGKEGRRDERVAVAVSLELT
jgi:hypothetical protein